MTTPVVQNSKANCLCGCGLFGTPRKRPLGHIRNCKCPKCQGKRNRSKGDTKALKARKALGIGGANTRHEELWGGNIRVEVKAGAQVNPIATRYIAAERQSEHHRPIADVRPFVFIAMPDGMSDGLIVMRLSAFAKYTGTNVIEQ